MFRTKNWYYPQLKKKMSNEDKRKFTEFEFIERLGSPKKQRSPSFCPSSHPKVLVQILKIYIIKMWVLLNAAKFVLKDDDFKNLMSF